MSAAMNGVWRPNSAGCDDYLIDGKLVAWLQSRPAYCDRGHWMVNADVPDLDTADMFPRYYMSRDVAIAETEAFIAWRLFKRRAPR